MPNPYDDFVGAIAGQSDTLQQHYRATVSQLGDAHLWDKRVCPHDWRYSSGIHMKVTEDYPFRYCVICGELVVNGDLVTKGNYPYA